MTERRVASSERRFASSRYSKCALAALVGLLLALAPNCPAQDLQLQPAEASDASVEPADENVGDQEVSAADLGNPAAPLDSSEPDAAPSSPNVVANPARPPSRSIADLQSALESRGDLNLHNVELRAALFMISEQWGINIVAGDVKGSVNGVFRQAPLREILDSILLSNGYNYRAVGESLVVSTVQELGQINPFFQSATIPVRSADIDEVVQGAKLLTTPKGQIMPIKSARSIVVLDFPDRVKMIRDFVTAIDSATRTGLGGEARANQPMEIGYFRTQYVPAKAVEEALQSVLSKEGRVGVMEKDDRLVISDYAENLAMVEMVLKRVDRPRPQVRITALIYDISLQDIERLGINWNSAIKGNSLNAEGDPDALLGVDSVMQVPFDATATGSALTFMNLSKHLDITAVVLALQNANDARLLADPHVCVLENEDAIFQSVSEIPYQQLTQTAQGGNIGTTAFKEAGITLKVRPKIAADGTIRMDVSPEFSRLTGFTPGDHQPIIDKRIATTSLRVQNGQTVVIGGLRQRADVGDFKGVPYLKDMRVVGKLFRSRDTNVRESELVVFISPKIIDVSDPLNHREQMVVDTMGCQLNRIPEGEGCQPECCPPMRLPPPCGPDGTMETPVEVIPPPMDQTSTSIMPVDGPPTATSTIAGKSGGSELIPPEPVGQQTSSQAASNGETTELPVNPAVPNPPIRRLPGLDEAKATKAATREKTVPRELFGAPPAIDSATLKRSEPQLRATDAPTIGKPIGSDPKA